MRKEFPEKPSGKPIKLIYFNDIQSISIETNRRQTFRNYDTPNFLIKSINKCISRWIFRKKKKNFY